MITLDQLRAIMPYAGRRAESFLTPLNSAMDEFSIDTPKRQAAFLAQVAHESGSLLLFIQPDHCRIAHDYERNRWQMPPDLR